MRLIDGDYLYNKLVANKCPYDLVLQMVKDEPTVCDIDAIKAEINKQAWAIAISDTDRANGMWDAYRIIDKYKEKGTKNDI